MSDNDIQARAKRIVEGIVPCSCPDYYTSRGLTEPECPRCNFAEDLIEAITKEFEVDMSDNSIQARARRAANCIGAGEPPFCGCSRSWCQHVLAWATELIAKEFEFLQQERNRLLLKLIQASEMAIADCGTCGGVGTYMLNDLPGGTSDEIECDSCGELRQVILGIRRDGCIKNPTT